ncbi:hypothetical protein Ddc_12706 [Ditylenchus destructor]|nr:hypothetical protein Ddc_12706 [Ditylenchus destructor]
MLQKLSLPANVFLVMFIFATIQKEVFCALALLNPYGAWGSYNWCQPWSNYGNYGYYSNYSNYYLNYLNWIPGLGYGFSY